MKKSRFTEEQIIGFIKQAQAGMPIKELCRKGGFSDATFYKWRAKFGGMDVPDAKRLRELEGENAKLKRLLAEAQKVQLNDHSNDTATQCTEVKNVDAACVNDKLTIGMPLGRFTPPVNQCQSFAYSVINSCRTGPQSTP